MFKWKGKELEHVTAQKISKNWVSQHVRGEHVAVTLETSWNTEHSTAEGYMTVGRQLGEAMADYFRALSKH